MFRSSSRPNSRAGLVGGNLPDKTKHPQHYVQGTEILGGRSALFRRVLPLIFPLVPNRRFGVQVCGIRFKLRPGTRPIIFDSFYISKSVLAARRAERDHRSTRNY